MILPVFSRQNCCDSEFVLECILFPNYQIPSDPSSARQKSGDIFVLEILLTVFSFSALNVDRGL